MSERPPSAASHPEELLADYVDGVLDEPRRERVEEHLEQCDQCREDVALSVQARAALPVLSELEGFGLADRIASGEMAGFDRRVVEWSSDGIIYPRGRTAPRRRDPSRVLVGAMAAVLVLLAGIVIVPRVFSSGGGASSARVAASAEQGVPSSSAAPLAALPVIDVHATYTTAQLDRLAARLSGTSSTRAPALSGGTAPTPAAATPTRSGSATYDAALSSQILDCLRTGAALEATATPIYLELATVNGVPAYVGAFRRANATLDFTLAAVARGGCTFLYGVSQPSA
jgi:anti-sigma factor RsiW